jgi:hypothetical protein
MMKIKIINFIVLIAMLLCFGMIDSIYANTFELNAIDSGNYEYSSGFMYSSIDHDPNDRAYSVEYSSFYSSEPGLDSDRRSNNFFVFDLPNISGGITGATLHLTRGMFGDYYTLLITYGLYDVLTPVADLVAGGHADYMDPDYSSLYGIYNDLGSGSDFGKVTISAGGGTEADILSISLTPSAVASINDSLGSLWAIGGKIDGRTKTGSWPPYNDYDDMNYMFVGTDSSSTMRLTLNQVPIPSTILLLSTGLLGLSGIRKKFKK